MVVLNCPGLFTKLLEAISEPRALNALKTREGWVRCQKAEKERGKKMVEIIK